jgi:hypothetical protein
MSSFEEIKIDTDFSLLRFQNDSDSTETLEKQVGFGLIQFHFNVKGKGKFIFNNNSYILDLNEEKALLLYNPQKELPLHLEIAPKSWIISILISIKKFHTLFSSDSEMIPFLSKDNLEKKKYIRAVIDKIEISSIKKKIINKMTRSNNIMIKMSSLRNQNWIKENKQNKRKKLYNL